MAISIDEILDKFIDVAREALPTELSLIGPSGTLPAVIRSRQKGSKPDYPYLVVDIVDLIDESGWLTNTYIDSNDHTVVETNKQLLINFRTYGGNAVAITNTLYGFFRLNRILGDIRNTLGGSVVTTSDIDQLPILLADKYLESASFNLMFNITDTFTDTSSEAFDTINITGELTDDAGDPVLPDIGITVPVP